MLVSTVSGRIRIRSNRLKQTKFGKAAQREAAAIEGVTDARLNTAAGSLIVSYDTRAVDTEELEDRLEALCSMPATRPANGNKTLSKRLNQATKVGMMATLATSLTYGVAGRKKEHIVFGTAFRCSERLAVIVEAEEEEAEAATDEA